MTTRFTVVSKIFVHSLFVCSMFEVKESDFRQWDKWLYVFRKMENLLKSYVYDYAYLVYWNTPIM